MQAAKWISCITLWCLLGLSLGAVSTPSHCTALASSVVVPDDQQVTFAILPSVPVACWSGALPVDGYHGQVLTYHVGIPDDQYLLDQNVAVQISINYNCTTEQCAQTVTTNDSADETCLAVASFMPVQATVVPMAAQLVSADSGAPFVPTEPVNFEFHFRWEDGDCSDDGPVID